MRKHFTTNAYDFGMQVLECGNCGAPLSAPLSGGHYQCRYCQAVNTPVALNAAHAPTDAPAPPSAPEPTAQVVEIPFRSTPQRVAWILTELSDPNRESRFDAVPEELSHFKGGATPFTWKRRLPVLKDHWSTATTALRNNPRDDAAAHRVFWIGLVLARIYLNQVDDAETFDKQEQAADGHLRRRAVLETALQLLESRPEAQIVRCRLAGAAARAGDVAAARRWLASCDPEPRIVDLDSELRIGMCFIAKAEDRPPEILEMVGEAGNELPLAMDRNRLLGDCFRIHAYEALGDLAQAKALNRKARQRHGAPFVNGCLKDLDLAPKTARAGCLVSAVFHLLPRLLILVAIIVAIIVLVQRYL